MRVKHKMLHLRQRQQRFDQQRRKQQKARLSLQRRRLLLKKHWLGLRRRINRWLTGENYQPEPGLQVELYRVRDRILRERETRVSER